MRLPAFLSEMARLAGEPAGTLLALVDQVLFGLSVAMFLRRYASKFDVVVVNQSVVAAPVLVLCRAVAPSVVYTSHSSRRFSIRPSMIDRIAVIAERFVVGRAGATIVGAVATKRELAKVRRAGRRIVRAIPTNCADPEMLDVEPDRVSDPFTTLSIPAGTRILVVGRVRPNKGAADLVSAVALLPARLQKQLQVVIVGPGEEFGRPVTSSAYAAEVLRLAQSLNLSGQVHLTGEVDVKLLRQLFLGADLFVLPSHSESSPRVLLEAMAAGLPVLASRVAGVEDQVTDGFDGLLFPPGNCAALAAALECALTSPELRERLGGHARGTARDRFSWDAITPQVEAVLRAVGSTIESDSGHRRIGPARRS